MCGIIAAISTDKRPINQLVLEQFEDQKSRGTRGFGASMLVPLDEWDQEEYLTRLKGAYAQLEANIKAATEAKDENDLEFWKFRLEHLKSIIDKDADGKLTLQRTMPTMGIKTFRSTGEIKAIIDLYTHKSNLALFHHRAPTSSDNLCSQTHPILVSNPMLDYDYLIVHNGIIHNEDKLKTEHEELGITYSTDLGGTGARQFNDSESLAVDIALVLEGQKERVTAEGSAAIIGLRLEKGGVIPLELFYARNSGNPINASRNNHYIFLSSTGRGGPVEIGKMTSIDLTTEAMEQESKTFWIPTYSYPATAPAAPAVGYNLNRTQNIANTPALGAPHGKSADPTSVTARKYYEDLEETTRTGEDSEFAGEFGAEADWLTERGELYNEELEQILVDFIETVCDPTAIDDADLHIKQMEETMARIAEEMRIDHIKAAAISDARDDEEEDKNGVVVETDTKEELMEAADHRAV